MRRSVRGYQPRYRHGTAAWLPCKRALCPAALLPRYAGVFEAVKIRKAGYPFRTPHAAFAQKYRWIARKAHGWVPIAASPTASPAEYCLAILAAVHQASRRRAKPARNRGESGKCRESAVAPYSLFTGRGRHATAARSSLATPCTVWPPCEPPCATAECDRRAAGLFGPPRGQDHLIPSHPIPSQTRQDFSALHVGKTIPSHPIPSHPIPSQTRQDFSALRVGKTMCLYRADEHRVLELLKNLALGRIFQHMQVPIPSHPIPSHPKLGRIFQHMQARRVARRVDTTAWPTVCVTTMWPPPRDGRRVTVSA